MINEPILIHYQLKPQVYIRFTLGVHSMGLTCTHRYSVVQKSAAALEILCAPSIHPGLPPTLATTDLFVVCIVFPFTERHVGGILHCGPFQIGIGHFHSTACIYVSSMSFHGLTVHSFLSQNNIPLYGYTTVPLSIHLLKFILVTSKFWKA